MKKNSDTWQTNAPYTCMQQRGTASHGVINGEFSLKSFVIKLVLGVIGGFGMWYLTISSEVGDSGMVIEPSKYLPIALCIILLIIGFYGLFELGKKVFNL